MTDKWQKPTMFSITFGPCYFIILLFHFYMESTATIDHKIGLNTEYNGINEIYMVHALNEPCKIKHTNHTNFNALPFKFRCMICVLYNHIAYMCDWVVDDDTDIARYWYRYCWWCWFNCLKYLFQCYCANEIKCKK